MIDKTKSIHTLMGILFSSLFIVSMAYAQKEQGSEEVLSHKPIKGHDTRTGMPFRVYESVRNQNFEAQKNLSKMTFYIAPLFRLIPEPSTREPYRRIVLEKEGIARYTFFVECFHPRIRRQALQTISNHYVQATGLGQFQFQLNKIQPMEHGLVVIKASLPGQQLAKAVKPTRKPVEAPPNTILTLKAIETFDLEVPLEEDDLFQQVLGEDGTGIEFEFTTYFNVMNLRIKQIVWRADHIRNSKAYQELTGQGAKYYDANQVRGLLDQVAREVATFDYQDSGIAEQLDNKVMQIFETLTQRTQDIALGSYEEAEEIEAKLLEGTGLSLGEFKPITLMWEVTEELKTRDKHKKANEAIRKRYENQKAALQKKLNDYKRRQKNLKRGFGIKGGFNYSDSENSTKKTLSLASLLGFSMEGNVNLNYDKSSDTVNQLERAIDKLKQLIKSESFKDQEEFKNYKRHLMKRQGKEVKIVGRGLNLIEKNHLDRNLSALGGYLAVRPFHEAKAFNVSSRLKPEHSPQIIPIEDFDFPLSLLKNTPFVEFYLAPERETRQRSRGPTKKIPVEKGQYQFTFQYSPPKASFYHFLVMKNNITQTEIVDKTGNIALTFKLEARDRVQLQIDCNRSYCKTGILSLTDMVFTKQPPRHW